MPSKSKSASSSKQPLPPSSPPSSSSSPPSSSSPNPTTATTLSNISRTEPLTNDLSRLYTHIHPTLLLAALFAQFPSIVASPVSALTTALLPLALLQVVHVVVCLPVARSDQPQTREKSVKGKRSSGDGKSEAPWGARITSALLSTLFALFAGTPPLLLALILLGAPLTSHLPHTALCALHLSLLTLVPLTYVHGLSGDKWRQICGLLLPIDEVVGGAMGTLVGAWLGAVPIPLDWDREWQAWPVTIVVGGYVGYVVGRVVGGTVLRGKSVRFD